MKKTLSFIKYIIAASVIFIITMKIIDMITPTSFITSFASFWGIYGIENVMDLYLDTSAMLSKTYEKEEKVECKNKIRLVWFYYQLKISH
ncbi:hypothetical protein [Photorhabdus sp. CRCIA-P01]|uniref:hypothetical protein n=1 Tax=Photorhabdus sp. CRCIA-P01 TaxID=2019570 RepID=UPI000E59FFEE|nr:hypothetical protein [Photorhabdus sp. CRCIA-P01]